MVVDVFREKIGEEFGIKFRIELEILIVMGFKSSFVVVNVFLKVLVDVFGFDMSEMEVVKVGVEVVKRVGVILIGVFDDVCVFYFGLFWVIDNFGMRVFYSFKVEFFFVVFLFFGKIFLIESLGGRDFFLIRFYVEEVRLVFEGEWRKVVFINGLVYLMYFGYFIEFFRIVLERGVVVGLSGKGLVVFVVMNELEEFVEEWE